MRQLPPLNALPAFEATARLGSVSAAAQELGRTHGAISKQLQALSEALGVELFKRAGTGLRLTAQGEALSAEVAKALDILAEATEQTRHDPGQPILTLGISATFASRWLMPRLPRFAARHPAVEIDFRMAGRVPFKVSECDLILSWDRLRTPRTAGEEAIVLGDVAFGMVHAPGYPVSGGDPDRHVDTRLLPDTNRRVWDDWAALSGVTVTSPRSYPVPQTGLLIDAATSGMGAAILERRLIEEELDDGRLVAPFGFQTIKDGFWAFLPRRSVRKPTSVAFIDWLREEA